jgi:hypothetical protein
MPEHSPPASVEAARIMETRNDATLAACKPFAPNRPRRNDPGKSCHCETPQATKHSTAAMREQARVHERAPVKKLATSLPESREKNRLDLGNRRSHHQQCASNQPLTKQTPGAVRDGSEGGRSGPEGASREGEPRHDASSSFHHLVVIY